MPTPTLSPWPSEPVATSANGRRGVGCPSRSLPELAQLQQFFRREQAGFGPGRIEQRRGMALGEDKPVIIMIMRVFRVIAHVPEKQRGHDVRCRAAGGRVSAAGRGGGSDGMNPQLIGDSLQQLDVDVVHEWQTVFSRRGKEKPKSRVKQPLGDTVTFCPTPRGPQGPASRCLCRSSCHTNCIPAHARHFCPGGTLLDASATSGAWDCAPAFGVRQSSGAFSGKVMAG